MYRRRLFARIAMGLTITFVVAGTMGSGCEIDLPEPTTIRLELLNSTESSVDPFLYIEESKDVTQSSQVIKAENFYDIVVPIVPGETVTLTIPCEDAGAIVTDEAEMLVTANSVVRSVTSPMVRQDVHFTCGDIVTFVFFENTSGVFRTAVAVNDQYVFN